MVYDNDLKRWIVKGVSPWSRCPLSALLIHVGQARSGSGSSSTSTPSSPNGFAFKDRTRRAKPPRELCHTAPVSIVAVCRIGRSSTPNVFVWSLAPSNRNTGLHRDGRWRHQASEVVIGRKHYGQRYCATCGRSTWRRSIAPPDRSAQTGQRIHR